MPKRKRCYRRDGGRVNGVGRVRVMDRFRWRRGGKSKDESRKRTGRCAMIPNVLGARAG